MKTVFSLIIISILVSGCTAKNISKEDPEFKFVYTEAKECVDIISKPVKENNEPYTLSFAYYTTSQSMPVMNGNFIKKEKKAIPYIIVPLQDKAQPGDKWRSCMLDNNALVPNIHFPK